MSERVERPDLETWQRMTRLAARQHMEVAVDRLVQLVAYALQVEQDAAGLQERLRAIEWDPETTPPQCAWCFGFQENGHHDGCPFAALLAAEPALDPSLRSRASEW